MPNQQLVDYINRQLQVGISKEEVHKALLDIGWSAPDIDEALKSIDSAKNADIVQRDNASAAFTPTVGPDRSKSGAMVMTPDIFQSKTDPMFEPNRPGTPSVSAQPAPAIQISKPVSGASLPPALMINPNTPSMGSMVVAQPKKGGRLKSFMIGILALGLAGASAEIYMLMNERTGLQNQIKLQSSGSGGDQQQMEALVQAKADLANQVTALNETNSGLMAELSIFAVPPTALANATGTAALKGMLGGDNKTAYTVRTKNDVVVSIKNSKDAKIDPVLKPLVGTAIEISGEHVLGSKEVTVNFVNGAAIPQ